MRIGTKSYKNASAYDGQNVRIVYKTKMTFAFLNVRIEVEFEIRIRIIEHQIRIGIIHLCW